MLYKNRKKNNTSPLSVSRPAGNWHLAWYLLIPLVLLLAIAAPWRRLVGNFFAPYLSVPAAIGNQVADQTLKMRSRTALAEEIVRLRKQNLLMTLELNGLRKLKDENIQLRAMLDLNSPPGYNYLTCSVILRDPWMWDSGFTIDRGSKDGLEPGLAVIAPAPDRQGRVILLGVIESVSKRTARVMSVLNPEFHISVSLPESGAVGFLNSGQNMQSSGGTAAIGFLPANRTFALNEPIYTTGFEAAVPAGLWVGSLESIAPSALPFDNRLYRRGVMRPAGNFEHLRTVVVARLLRMDNNTDAER